MTSKNRKFGDLGEKIAKYHLEKNGYKIIEKNYTRKIGEIDIIAKKYNKLHFCEVKTRSMFNVEHYLPEYSIDKKKREKLMKICELYLLEKKYKHSQKWQIDVISISINYETQTARINHIDNAILSKNY